MGLSVPKLVVLAGFIGNQLVVTAKLNQMSLMEYGDLVTELAGGQAMADEHRMWTLPFAPR